MREEIHTEAAIEPGGREFYSIPVQVIALGLARFADAFGNALLFVVLPLYFHSFHSDALGLPPELVVGLLVGVGPLVSFMVQPFVGAVADHTGRFKLIILIGLAVTAIANAGFIFSTNVWHLAFFRSLQGVGVGLTIPTALALTSSYSRIGNRGRSMSFFIGARMLGLGLGPLVGGLTLVEFGYTFSLTLAVIMVCLGFAAVTFLVKETRVSRRDSPHLDPVSFVSIFRQRGFLVIALINVIMAMSLNILAPLESQVNQRLDQTAAEFGIALSISLFSNLVFQFASGPLADRFGRKPVIITGLCIIAPATAMLPFATSTEMLWTIQVFEGAAVALIGSPSYALAGDMARQGGVGKQLSILSASFGLGLAIGPFTAGIFAGYLGFHAPFFMAAALAATFALVATFRLRDVMQR